MISDLKISSEATQLTDCQIGRLLRTSRNMSEQLNAMQRTELTHSECYGSQSTVHELIMREQQDSFEKKTILEDMCSGLTKGYDGSLFLA